jgi:hypothetical protein
VSNAARQPRAGCLGSLVVGHGPLKNPREIFRRFRKRIGGGILVYGPPGCGKTLLARATPVSPGLIFLNVSIADVLSMWFAESEHNLKAIFDKARASPPTVVSLTSSRRWRGGGGRRIRAKPLLSRPICGKADRALHRPCRPPSLLDRRREACMKPNLDTLAL